MNQRQIDLALLAGIGVLLIAILVLALSAAPMRGASADNPPNTENTGQSETTTADNSPSAEDTDQAESEAQGGGAQNPSEEVSAVDVTSEETDAEAAAQESAEDDVQAVQPDEAQADAEAATGEENPGEAQSAEQAGEETSDQAAATDEPQETAAQEQAAPTGAVNLDRVGFAFITAESGACSIPLQPWRQVAVSRDLLAQYGCGATITLDLADTVNGNQQVTAQIADTMNPSFERTVNIFVAEEEPALEYGVTTGTLQSTSP